MLSTSVQERSHTGMVLPGTRTGRTAPLTTYASLCGASAVRAMRTAVSSSPPTQVASDGARFSTSGSIWVKKPFESDGATVAWRRQYGRPRTIRLCSSHHVVPHFTCRRST